MGHIYHTVKISTYNVSLVICDHRNITFFNLVIILVKMKVLMLHLLALQLLLILSLLLLSHINMINYFLFLRQNAKNYGYGLP